MEELKKRVAAMPDDVKVEAICELAWDLFGVVDAGVQYIDTDRTPDLTELRNVLGTVREALTKDRELKVKKVIRNGELEIEPGHTIPEIVEQAAACLDRACSWDICGEILFLGDDDLYYVGTVEFTVGLANPKYLEEALKEDEEEDEEDEQ